MLLSSSFITMMLFNLLLMSTQILHSGAFSGISTSSKTTSTIFSTRKPFSTRSTFYPNHILLDQEEITTITSSSCLSMSGFHEISAISSSAGMILADNGNVGDTIRYVVTTLFLFGGLIPTLITANKSLFTTLTGGKKVEKVTKTSLDPTGSEKKTYISSSGATGPSLPNSALIFGTETIPLVDIIAIAGRMTNANSVADWKNLPSTRVDDLLLPDNPPMWLPRATFKANIRAAKFQYWPVDPQTGQPVGGEELVKSEMTRVKKAGVLIGDAALDAVFDTWASGAAITTPDKVEKQLKEWRNDKSFDLGKFTTAAILGRAVTGFAAFSFIVIQLVAFSLFIIKPALSFLFDIDIDFGF